MYILTPLCSFSPSFLLLFSRGGVLGFSFSSTPPVLQWPHLYFVFSPQWTQCVWNGLHLNTSRPNSLRNEGHGDRQTDGRAGGEEVTRGALKRRLFEKDAVRLDIAFVFLVFLFALFFVLFLNKRKFFKNEASAVSILFFHPSRWSSLRMNYGFKSRCMNDWCERMELPDARVVSNVNVACNVRPGGRAHVPALSTSVYQNDRMQNCINKMFM